MGCGVALTNVTEGNAPVIAPVLSTGKTTWAMNTFHASVLLVLVLGSTLWFEPYHTASARPAAPALIHGKTLTIDGALLTWTGAVQVRQPPAADAALTKVCRWAGCEASAERV